MNQIAVEAALLDDATMPRRKKSGYVPPRNLGEISLSQALQDTGRLSENPQSDFLGRTKTVGDQRIFYSGELNLLKRPCVSIVGAREVSDAGRAATQWLAQKLSSLGIVIVSGLAQGVDTAAHTSAIQNGGKTIAVIGTPLDKAYPAENANLQEQIYQQHLLISQFARGEKTYRSSFPLRNRLMATLSDATVVMEASDTSGTLHQAAECTKLGRWLFIAKSVVEDPKRNWPQRFLKYDTCVVLEKVSQITDRMLKSSR